MGKGRGKGGSGEAHWEVLPWSGTQMMVAWSRALSEEIQKNKTSQVFGYNLLDWGIAKGENKEFCLSHDRPKTAFGVCKWNYQVDGWTQEFGAQHGHVV